MELKPSPVADDRRGSSYQTLSRQAIVTSLKAYCYLGADGPAGTTMCERHLDVWMAQGLAADRRRGEAYFDWADVANFMISQAAAGTSDFYAKTRVEGLRRDARALRRYTPSTRLEVRLAREFNVPAAGAKRVKLRLPAPLGDQHCVDLAAAGVDAGGRACKVVQRPGVLEVECDRPATSEVMRLEVVYSGLFQGRAELREALSAADRETYLQPEQGPYTLTAPLRECARSLCSGGDVDAVILAVWRFFLQHLQVGVVHHARAAAPVPPCTGLLVDCFLGSSLFVILCRALAVPARVVSGILLFPGAPAPHFWVEAHCPRRGWITVDLAAWELAGPEHTHVSEWTTWFLGADDKRFVAQVFPGTYMGQSGVSLPPDWIVVPELADAGFVTAVCDRQGALLYRDTIQISEA